jgi:hypothetical protein
MGWPHARNKNAIAGVEMNPNCSIDLTTFTIEQDHKPITFTSIIGNVCPTLLYVVAPYMMAMKKGIHFPWEKGIDTVLVTCPAGHVDCELRDMHDNTFRITILQHDGNCPKYALNNVIEIPMHENVMQAFNDIFPFLFYVSEGDTITLRGNVSIKRIGAESARSTREISACGIQTELDNAGVLIDVEGMKRSCAYHRRAKTVPEGNLVPPGLCFMAYQTAYPAFLAMLYGEGIPDTVSLSCQGTKPCIEFSLERKARVIKPFLDIFEKLLSFTPVRLDIIKYRVKLKVVATEGSCEKHMNRGTNNILGKKRYLCPSSFYSLFPALVSRLGNHSQAACTCTCTSVPCHVTYKIRPIYEKEQR